MKPLFVQSKECIVVNKYIPKEDKDYLKTTIDYINVTKTQMIIQHCNGGQFITKSLNNKSLQFLQTKMFIFEAFFIILPYFSFF